MTELRQCERALGKEGVKRLPAKWRRHIKRIDELPKPVKPIPLRRIREILGA